MIRSRVMVLVTAAAAMATGLIAGPASAAKQARLPSPPRDVHVVSTGDRWVSLAWSAPADNGGRAIRNYRITELTTGATKVVSGSKLTEGFGELTNLAPAQFVVVATNPAGASEPSAPSEVAYPRPTLRLITTRIPEGLKPVDQAVEVGVWSRAAQPIQIRVRTLTTGKAKPGKDVDPLDTVVTLPANTMSVSVPIHVIDDARVEGDEKLALEISSPNAVRPENASLLVQDDDASPWLYLDGAERVAEGDTGITPMRFGLRLSKPLTEPLTVGVDVTQDGQHQLVELGELPTSVTIPAGTTSVPLDVPVLGDRIVEPSEQVSVRIVPPAGVTAPVLRRGSLAVDDDTVSSGSGADVSLQTSWATDVPDGPAARFTVRNTSTVKATGVRLSIMHVGYYLEGDVSLLPTNCRYVGTVDRQTNGVWERVHRWTCDIGDLAPGATTTLLLGPPREGTVIAGVTTLPYDDPDHANNLATLSYP